MTLQNKRPCFSLFLLTKNKPGFLKWLHVGFFLGCIWVTVQLTAGCVVEPHGGSTVPKDSEKEGTKGGTKEGTKEGTKGVENLRGFQYSVVGTIHKFHLIQKYYPIQTLGALVDAYSPDLILVEIRPTAFSQGHLEDGPFEMAYVTHLAREKKIPVVPIDWWLESEAGGGGGDGPKSKAQRQKFMRAVKPYMKGIFWPPSFTQVHSSKYTRRMLMVINARARLLSGTPSWNRRQAWFHFQATQALLHHRPRKVMAFVGAQHRPELKAHLAALGGKAINPREVLRDVLKERLKEGLKEGFKEVLTQSDERISELSKTPIPQTVFQAWREGIGRLEAERQAATGPLKVSYEKKILYFKVAVSQGGRCCVKPKMLFGPEKIETPRGTPRETPRGTPRETNTETPTQTPTETNTETKTDTKTESPTQTPTETNTETNTDNNTETPTQNPTETPIENPDKP